MEEKKEEQKKLIKLCPDCGGEMIPGEAYVTGSKGSGLLGWKTDEKHLQTRKRLFGGEKKVCRRIDFSLLTSYSFFADESKEYRHAGVYCPRCGKLYLDPFDVEKREICEE